MGSCVAQIHKLSPFFLSRRRHRINNDCYKRNLNFKRDGFEDLQQVTNKSTKDIELGQSKQGYINNGENYLQNQSLQSLTQNQQSDLDWSVKKYQNESIKEGPNSLLNFVDIIQDGPPRFGCPINSDVLLTRQKELLPLMLYIPGIDGTGFAAAYQFPNLLQNFDLRHLIVPPTDRSTFQQLLSQIKEYLTVEVQRGPSHRPIYVLGESFGGLMALAVGAQCHDIVDRLILVNPASSYDRTLWAAFGPIFKALPQDIYQYLPYLFAPLLVSPQGILNSNSIQDLLQSIAKLVGQLPLLDQLNVLLPADTLNWKLQCLQDGCDYLTDVGYQNIQQPTLVLTGDIDMLVPSGSEGPRLEKILPNAQNVRFTDRAHTLIQDDQIDLSKIIKENNFYTTSRLVKIMPGNTQRKLQVFKDNRSFILEQHRRIASPIYLSTDNSGSIVQGLEHFPHGEQILLIGNHQQSAINFDLVVEKLSKERGINLKSMTDTKQQQNAETTAMLQDNQPDFHSILHNMFSQGESVVLFPGAVQQITKGFELQSELICPETEDFVSIASNFGVTIIPFSCVSGERQVELVSAQNIFNFCKIADIFRSDSRIIWSRMINDSAYQKNVGKNLSPTGFGVSLTFPARFYVKFGKAIRTRKSWQNDESLCGQISNEIKNSILHGFEYLSLKQHEDPYRDLLTRLLYEFGYSYAQQAPTFDP